MAEYDVQAALNPDATVTITVYASEYYDGQKKAGLLGVHTSGARHGTVGQKLSNVSATHAALRGVQHSLGAVAPGSAVNVIAPVKVIEILLTDADPSAHLITALLRRSIHAVVDSRRLHVTLIPAVAQSPGMTEAQAEAVKHGLHVEDPDSVDLR